jgi:hypothetical protein
LDGDLKDSACRADDAEPDALSADAAETIVQIPD